MQFFHVMYGSDLIQVPRPGENLRAFYQRVGRLRLRANGALDMRFWTSKRVAEDEA
jgi:hypothetical protein